VKINCILFPPVQLDISQDYAVVIDVLRATTNILCLFERGARVIRPIQDVEEAKQYKLHNPHCVLAGERDGKKLEGFFLGNSPVETLGAKIKGKEIVLSTTNGTNAILAAGKAYKAYVGSLLNLTKLAETIGQQLRDTRKDLNIICSGTEGQVSLEDLYCAGALIQKAVSMGGLRGFEMDDGAKVAKMVHGGFGTGMDAMLASSHGKRLSNLTMTGDIALCSKTDLMPFLPQIINDNGVHIVCEMKED
jgi:2-phosphosulfolactate phosphatase